VIPIRRKRAIAHAIMRILCMLASVHFDNKLLVSTNKIHDVGPNRFLANEFEAPQATIPQGKPKLRLCNGCLSAQAPFETNGPSLSSAQGSPLTPTLSPLRTGRGSRPSSRRTPMLPRYVLAILEAVSDDARRQRLHLGAGLCLSVSIGEHARQCGHFRNPAAVFLAFDLNLRHKFSPKKCFTLVIRVKQFFKDACITTAILVV
jgi:hypothetical protein